MSVKHLNPRQGITICIELQRVSVVPLSECETPKSPPGDYNSVVDGWGEIELFVV